MDVNMIKHLLLSGCRASWYALSSPPADGFISFQYVTPRIMNASPQVHAVDRDLTLAGVQAANARRRIRNAADRGSGGILKVLQLAQRRERQAAMLAVTAAARSAFRAETSINHAIDAGHFARAMDMSRELTTALTAPPPQGQSSGVSMCMCACVLCRCGVCMSVISQYRLMYV